MLDDSAEPPKMTALHAGDEGLLDLPPLGRFLEPPVRAAVRATAAIPGDG